jgi:hypothetical protein
MPDPADRTLDLEPAKLAAIEQRLDKVVLVFPSQPSFLDGQTHVPSFVCELHIYGGVIEHNDATLPLETEDWRVEYRGGARMCFLPVDFTAEGPVRVTFWQHAEPKLVVSGDRVELIVGRQVESYAIRWCDPR